MSARVLPPQVPVAFCPPRTVTDSLGNLQREYLRDILAPAEKTLPGSRRAILVARFWQDYPRGT